MLTDEIRLSAFEVTIPTNKRRAALQTVIKAFDLGEDGNDFLVPCVKIFVYKKDYKEVSVLNTFS